MIRLDGNAADELVGQMLKTLALSLLPTMVSAPLRTSRRVGHAVREHKRLEAVFQPVRSELMEGAQLLSDRSALLDVLPKNAVVAEIGVALGNFSTEIIARSAPRKLHLIDPWDQSVPKYSPSALAMIQRDKRTQIDNGSVILNRGYSTSVLANFDDDYFDWVYVDGAHDYDGVSADLHALYSKVKHGGIISGHDYVRWASPCDRYGVVEAVNEFLNRTGSPLIYLTNQADKHDSFALRLKKA